MQGLMKGLKQALHKFVFLMLKLSLFRMLLFFTF